MDKDWFEEFRVKGEQEYLAELAAFDAENPDLVPKDEAPVIAG